MAKLVPIRLTIDGTHAKAEIRAVAGELRNLNNLTTRQASRSFSNSQFDTRAAQDFIRLSKESQKIAEINARTQGRLAEETARRTTHAKQSELRAFEQAERHKQRISEISAKQQVQSSNNAFKSQEAAKRREYQEFVRLEREKTRVAQAESRRRQSFGQNADMLGGGMRGAGMAMTAGVTLPIIAGFAAVIKIGSEYETSMNLLQATTKASSDEMIRADKIAMQLGSDLSLPKVSAKDAAEAMLELGKAGMTVSQSMDAAKGTLQLATAANITAGEAAEITANALNMFSLDAKEAGRVADLLAGAANASSAEITDIAQSLQQSGAVFANAKVPIEDVVALIGEMANAGIKGSDAGTSLKTMMQRLQSPTDAAMSAMKSLNVEIYDQQGKMRPMRDIIDQFSTSLKGLTQEQRDQALNTIFGADAVRAATIVFGQGAEGFDKMKEAVMRQNAAAELSAARSKGLAGAWNALKSQAETLGLVIYNRIKVPLTEIAIYIATFVGKVTDAFMNLSPGVQQGIVAFVGLVAALGPVLTVVGVLVVAISSVASGIAALGGLSVVLPILAGIAAALAGLAIGAAAAVKIAYELVNAWQNGFGPVASYVALVVGSIMTAISPIIGLPILIGAVLATLYGIWVTNFGGIRDVVLTAVNEITTLVNNFIAQIQPYLVDGIRFIQQKFAEYWNKFAPAVSDATNQIRSFLFESWSQISAFLQDNFAGITEYFRENWDSIREAAGRIMDAIVLVIRVGVVNIRQFWADHGEQIKSVASSAWNIVRTIVTGIVTQIGNVIKLVAQVINGDWAGAWQTFKNIVYVGVTGLISILGSLGNIIWQIVKGIITRVYANIRNSVGELVAVGKHLIDGLIRGITGAAGALYEKAKSVISGVINIFRTVPQVESPSKVTTEIGQFIAEGLGVGLQNRANQIKEIAKKVTKDALGEMKKEAAKAKKEFDDLLGSSSEKQGLIVSTSDFQAAKSNLETLIKLRAELGLNVGSALPSALPQITAEIDALNEQKQGREDAIRLLKEYEDAVRDYGIELTHVQKIERLLNDPNKAVLIDAETAAKLRAAAADRDRLDAAKRLDDFKKSVESSALSEQFNLSEQNRLMQEQIRLGRELTAVERERIKQEFDLAKLETTEAFIKLTPEQQQALRDFIQLQNETTVALIEDAQALKQTIDAGKAYSDLLSELNGKMVETNNLTEYARVQKLLETEAYKNLDAAQKEVLLNKAKEVDAYREQIKAAEEARQKMEAIYNGLSDSIFNVLSASVRGGFKEGLKTAFDELKNFGLSLLDTILRELSNRLAQFILKKIFGGSGSGSSGGGIFGGIFSGIFGGGSSSGSGGGGIFGNIFSGIFGGGTGRGSSPNFGGLINQANSALGIGGGSNAHEAAHNLGGRRGRFNLASGLALGGVGLGLLGGLIGGRAGRSLSGAGSGIGLGMAIGSIVPGLGTVIGGLIGGIAGGIFGLFGDPKRRIDKKENMPKLTQGFADALAELRKLASDKNAIFNDPDGVLARATEIRAQIAGGFGIAFQSKKYRGIAQQQIASKLAEADAIIKQIREMSDEAKRALDVDNRLETSFASGVYMSPAFLKQFGAFKRRNGMLSGAFTGRDTLPSFLAPGEMVLNPYQIAAVRRNAGFDAFAGAGIPNYASGVSFAAPSAPAPSASRQPIVIQLYVSNSGMVETDIKEIVKDSLGESDVQVEIVRTYDKGKSRKLK